MIYKRYLNRKYLIIIILLLLSTTIQAQTKEPTFSKKSSWKEITTNLFDSTFFEINTFSIKGDTIINGKNYSKIYANNKYYSAFRETEDNRIYIYWKDEYPSGEYLTYDFDWYPGKKLYKHYPNPSTGEIDSVVLVTLGNNIDSIQLLDGKYYQYVKIGNSQFGPEMLIKGIGDTFYPFSPLGLPTNGDQYALLCFYIDDILVYSNSYFNCCFVPVIEIIDVPKTAITGIQLELSGTILPSNATYKDIVWSVYDTGTTGATINDNILYTTDKGTVTVTAIVKYDVAIDTVYKQNFTIEVESVGINNYPQESSHIRIYPNPSNHSITVEFSENLDVDTFEIYDIKGSLVKSYDVKGEKTVVIQNIATGKYVYAAILKNKQKLTGKLIIN